MWPFKKKIVEIKADRPTVKAYRINVITEERDFFSPFVTDATLVNRAIHKIDEQLSSMYALKDFIKIADFIIKKNDLQMVFVQEKMIDELDDDRTLFVQEGW